MPGWRKPLPAPKRARIRGPLRLCNENETRDTLYQPIPGYAQAHRIKPSDCPPAHTAYCWLPQRDPSRFATPLTSPNVASACPKTCYPAWPARMCSRWLVYTYRWQYPSALIGFLGSVGPCIPLPQQGNQQMSQHNTDYSNDYTCK